MKKRIAPVLYGFCGLGLLLGAGCRSGQKVEADPEYVAAIKAWQQQRVENLKKETGWLNLAGLYWLEQGVNRAGAGEDNELVFPAGKAPERLGRFVLKNGEVEFIAAPGAVVLHEGKPVQRISLQSDKEGKPTVLGHGTLRWFIIDRSGRLGVRLRDLEAETLVNFKGLEYYPIDPAWRVEARFEPYDPPKKVAIPTVLGTVLQEPSPGALVFEIGGQTYRLDPTGELSDDELFLIFADETNGAETYGAGRFLYVKTPGADGRTVIDFNKAYNPPCAFTPYATCPMPPEQNKLPIKVTAGEKAYGDGHH